MTKYMAYRCDLCNIIFESLNGFGCALTESGSLLIIIDNFVTNKHICKNCYEIIGRHHENTKPCGPINSRHLSTCEL